MLRLRRSAWFHRLACTLMVLAALAFTHQGAMAGVAQAAASVGVIVEPAVPVSGPVHYHGDVARHFHAHADQADVGHTHDHGDLDHDDGDKHASPAICAIGVCCAVSASPVNCVLPVAHAIRIAPGFDAAVSGVEPDNLQRPPSTPSIA